MLRVTYVRGPLVPALASLGLAACFETAPPPSQSQDPDPGYLTVDSTLVIDQFAFTTAGCSEVLPDSFANADSLPATAAAVIMVTSNACYAVHITIEDDSTHVVVRTLDRYFGIYGRRDGEKNRGEIGYLAWDGRDDQGRAVARGKYLWRLRFDFGGGNAVKYRAVVWL